MTFGGWAGKQVSKGGRALRKATDRVGNVLKNTPGLDYAINPLIAQDIMGAALAGSLSRGADARTALAASTSASGNLASGGSAAQWGDLATFNAALVSGAAGGAALGGAMSSGGGLTAAQWAAQGSMAPGLLAPGTAALAGAAVGAGVYAGTQALNVASTPGISPTAPPDVQEKNDPSTAAQFLRMRKAARMLGRAGTIKNKGSADLGLGDQGLGTPLSTGA